MSFGVRLRSIRKSQKLSLADIATRTGLSISMISQLERGITSPSVSSLKKVAAALSTNVANLFEEEEELPRLLVKKTERMDWQLRRTRFELLAPDRARKMEPLLITYQKGGTSGEQMIEHEGEEFGIVLKGRAEYWVGSEKMILEEGDSIYFRSDLPHKLVNIGEEECKVLWVLTPPTYYGITPNGHGD